MSLKLSINVCFFSPSFHHAFRLAREGGGAFSFLFRCPEVILSCWLRFLFGLCVEKVIGKRRETGGGEDRSKKKKPGMGEKNSNLGRSRKFLSFLTLG